MNAASMVAVCFIIRGNQILLMRHDKPFAAGRWSVIGGHVEPGETPEQAVHREVAEETGLTLTRCRSAGHLLQYEASGNVTSMNLFVATEATGDLRGSPEGDPVWWSLSQVAELPVVPIVQFLLPRVLAPGALVSGVVHTGATGEVTGSELQTTQAWASVAAFLDHWDGVRMVTLELLRCFSDADLTYRLVPEWRTVGELLHHIGGHQFFAARGVLLGQWRPRPGDPDQDWQGHAAATTGSVAALYRWLAETQQQMRAWAETAPPERLADLRPDNPWHEGIRGWLLLHHAYQDELHHRGQLYAIARQLGKRPPFAFAEEYPSYWDAHKGH
jgi:8-oxo-dGTP pyrophosphatase MutT (NUDIX family)/uncharacterized damage-inducible protein DinB